MELWNLIFGILLFAILYPYLLYPLLLTILVKLKPNPKSNPAQHYEPTATLFVTAYNEASYVQQKVQNSLALNYSQSKLQLVWVTDGSTDDTNQKLTEFNEVKVYFEPERKGKIQAMNRGMQFVDTEIVVFTDGNTLLNVEAISEIVACFANPKVACVAGEKRILTSETDNAAGLGEGFYWKYESYVKMLDARIGSAIGAPGELFAIRRALFEPVEPDTILDDFVISMRLALQGYKIGYTPKAYAVERASANVAEEMKRKVRIAAGSFQVLFRLRALLNPFHQPVLWFQYLSHKVFRWVFAPLSLPFLLLVNGLICFNSDALFYNLILVLQIVFYTLVLLGGALNKKSLPMPMLFVPYYFFMANWAMWRGFFRYLKGQQPAAWERAQRAV